VLRGDGDVAGTYCPASSTVCDEYISRVQVGTIDNPSTCLYYFDYAALSTPMVVGTAYALTVTNGQIYYFEDQCGVWWTGTRTLTSPMMEKPSQ